MSDLPNPFAAPLSDEPGPLGNSSEFRIVGNDLFVRTGTTLPAICVKTGEPVEGWDMQTKKLTWCTPWVGLLILLSPLILLLVYLITKKTCALSYGLSRDVRRKYRNRLAIKATILIAAIVSMFAGFKFEIDPLIVVGLIGSVIALIWLLVGNSPIRLAGHNGGVFTVRGCSREFLNAVAEM